MKWRGRPKSKNVVDKRGTFLNNVEVFLGESLKMASSKSPPLPRKRPKVAPIPKPRHKRYGDK